MYTTHTGKIFLDLYNRKTKKKLNAKEFCKKILIPIAFDHEKLFFNISNSAFFQLNFFKKENGKKTNLTKSSDKKERKEAFKNFFKKIENNEIHQGTAPGYWADNNSATTSSQITNINFNLSEEEIYLSWIGYALSIRINGGLILNFDNENILWDIFNGWKYYRKMLNVTKNMKGNQLETWNGLYLKNLYQKSKEKIQPENEGIALSTVKWIDLILELTKEFPKQELIVYVNSISQMNQSIGFIILKLPSIIKLYEFYQYILKINDVSSNDRKQIGECLGNKSFIEQCKVGSIGIKQLEPYKLEELIQKKTEEKKFFIIKTWIIAMLNKKEISNFSTKFAQQLIEFENEKTLQDRGKTGTSKKVEELLDSKTINFFIEKLTNLLSSDAKSNSIFKEILEVSKEIKEQDFKYFTLLIKFEYNLLKNNKKGK